MTDRERSIVKVVAKILRKNYEGYYATQGYPLPQNSIDFEEGIACEILALLRKGRVPEEEV